MSTITSPTSVTATAAAAIKHKPLGLAQEFAKRVVAMKASDLPQEAFHWAHVGILDTIGVTLAGSTEPTATLAAQALDLSEGPALILGTHQRVGMLDAALINGAASHALDFDDCNNTIGGHPSAPVLSALLPLADALGSSGEDFVTAYIAGFEVETKLGMAVNMHHYMKGWHPTATLGTFGAAAAAAKLMGLDAEQTGVALALAASFASGLKANFGTMTKPLHVGHCARNGLFAARLASKGYTANAAKVFEHKQGFLDVFNGPGTYDVERALDAWARPLDIIQPGIAIKQYPCCGSTHPAIDAMLDIVRRHNPDVQAVERVDVAVHSRRLEHTNRPNPGSPLDAKFSLQYVMARALIEQHIGVADFEGDAYRDSRVHDFLPRVHVQAYNETGLGGFDFENHFGGIVKVTMKNGTLFEAQVDQPLGRTSANPLPEALLREKFNLCAATVLRQEAIGPIADSIWQVESLPSMRTLSQLIQQATH